VRYRTIVADPPWHYGTTMPVWGDRSRDYAESGTPYVTMTLEEIAALPVRGLADDGAHLYLWTTNTHVEHAWSIARGWGFTPKNLLTWCKRPKGMVGFGTFSQSSEFVLFASTATIHTGRSERTWFEWPRGLHSAKPDAFLDLVEQISPGPYLELFARRQRLGWDTWGDEALCHVELDSRHFDAVDRSKRFEEAGVLPWEQHDESAA
jgi:N6-adenosine-specific RNA methylase IME4